MEKSTKRVGLIATGDELVNGDIINTNAQYFTAQLVELGISPGRQVIVADNKNEIKQAITYLLQDHQAVITIGGLGPTSDDLTRFAFAEAIGRQLEFDQVAWEWLLALLREKGLKIPNINRQQAQMPKGSQAIRNYNGTAAACYLDHEGHDLFMLPGPPSECRPIFDKFVIKKLLKKKYARQVIRKSWLLINVSESSIAQQLEPIMKNFSNCQLGYRCRAIGLRSEQDNLSKAKLDCWGFSNFSVILD